MAGSLLLVGIMTAAYLSFALLALTQARPWQRLGQAAPPTNIRRLVLRALGGLALGLSLVLCLVRDGPSFGALLWATAISIAAAAVAFTLTWCPALLRPLAAMATVGIRPRRGRTETDWQGTAKVPPSNPTRL